MTAFLKLSFRDYIVSYEKNISSTYSNFLPLNVSL